VVLLCGKVSGRERDEEDPPLFLDTARPLDDVAGSGEISVQIELELGSTVPEAAFAEAKKVLAEHPGPAPVLVQVGSDNGEQAPRLKSRSLHAAADADTVRALQKLFGRGNVRLVRTLVPQKPGDPWT
jgi:DNA polymerase III subunit alpha